MLVPVAIPQATINGALETFFGELNGKGIKSITDDRPLDRVLTPAQTAALLGRTTKTVRELARRGRIKAVMFGDGSRVTGYSEQSVRDFINGGREG